MIPSNPAPVGDEREREAFEEFWLSPVEGGSSYDECYGQSHRLVAEEAFKAGRSSSTVQQVGADDTARLDWLERRINEDGAIHLHDGKHPHGTGLGLRPGLMVRTLRQAIDQAMPKSEQGDQQ